MIEGEEKGDRLKTVIHWEKLLHIKITEEDWTDMCVKTTNSSFWREFSWKLQIRYFKTPTIQAKYDNKITASTKH